MKYNPKFCDAVAADPGLNSVHPGAPAELTQGWLELLVTLEEKLCVITGMSAATLQPAAGAHGELTGVLGDGVLKVDEPFPAKGGEECADDRHHDGRAEDD